MAKLLHVVFSVFFLLFTFFTCAKPAPADFKVLLLEVKPIQVTNGEPVTVFITVKNIGAMVGTYQYNLLVDGVSNRTEAMTLDPGKLQIGEILLNNYATGTHVVSVGEMNSSFTVSEKIVTREVEMKYGNKEVGGPIIGVLGGFLMDFSPPVVPLTINKIRIMGMLPSSIGGDVVLELWNAERKMIYKETFPDTRFPQKTDVAQMSGGQLTRWTEFQIPNITVSDKFFVHLWKGTRTGGLHLAVDSTIENQHSNITTLSGDKIVEPAIWTSTNFCTCSFVEKSECNWMIRVTGKGDFPER